ncbi:MAG: hypothetical protein HY614_02790 [Candidatus Rokubacteria bacterium]|nr:hypothetical protein [Candidatus Rokubacteria bacterium]
MRGSIPTVAMVLLLFVSAAAEAQDGLTKLDRQGPVTVAVTLAAPPAVATPIKAKVVFDTHSVELDDVVFEQAVALRGSDGRDVAPASLEQAKGSGHHREAVLVFPPLADGGQVRVVVKDVGGVAERVFTWDTPVGR